MPAAARAGRTRERRGMQRLQRDQRLSSKEGFTRCYRAGRRFHARTCNVLFVDSSIAEVRLGISVGRRVGKAVVRNRIRRWVRETFRRCSVRSRLRGLDLVVHVNPQAGEAEFLEMKQDLESLFQRVARRSSGRSRVARP